MENSQKTKRGLNELVYALYDRANRQNLGQSGQASEPMLGTVPLVEDPVEIDILAKRPDQFIKNFSLISAFGHSRFNTDGEEWAIRRDLTQPTFLEAGKAAKRAAIYDSFRSELEGCDEHVLAVQDAIFRASLKIFCQAFGFSPDIEPTIKLLDRVRTVLRELQFYSWSAPSHDEQSQTLNEAHNILGECTEVLGANKQAQLLLDRFKSDASNIENFSPIEEFVMNLFAGIETTVCATCWFIDRLSMNQQVQERIASEILQGEKSSYTDCMINETMRYFPPIPFVVRQVSNETKIGNRVFHKGQLVLISIVGAHHHANYWKDPSVFDSSRSEFMEDRYDRRAFIPFLTGPRMCGGARLGRLEIQEATRAIVQMFEFERSDDIVRFDYGLALKPDTNSSISVNRRV